MHLMDRHGDGTRKMLYSDWLWFGVISSFKHPNPSWDDGQVGLKEKEDGKHTLSLHPQELDKILMKLSHGWIFSVMNSTDREGGVNIAEAIYRCPLCLASTVFWVWLWANKGPGLPGLAGALSSQRSHRVCVCLLRCMQGEVKGACYSASGYY